MARTTAWPTGKLGLIFAFAALDSGQRRASAANGDGDGSKFRDEAPEEFMD